MDDISPPGFIVGVLLTAISSAALLRVSRAFRPNDATASSARPAVTTLVFGLLALAGLLLVLWSANFSGNLGR